MDPIEHQVLCYARDNGGITAFRPARQGNRIQLRGTSVDELELRQVAKSLEGIEYLEPQRRYMTDGREATLYVVTAKGRAVP